MCSVYFWRNCKQQYYFRYKPRYGAMVELDKYFLDACAVACLPSKLCNCSEPWQLNINWDDGASRWRGNKTHFTIKHVYDCSSSCISNRITIAVLCHFGRLVSDHPHWLQVRYSPMQSSLSLFVRLHDNLHKVLVVGQHCILSHAWMLNDDYTLSRNCIQSVCNNSSVMYVCNACTVLVRKVPQVCIYTYCQTIANYSFMLRERCDQSLW